MEAFATVEELEARWRMLDDDEKGVASALLDDATAFLHAEFARLGRTIDENDDLLMANLKRVCCSITSRTFPTDQDGITQFSVTTGPFTRSQTITNPSRDMFLTKQERVTLGLPMKRQHVRFFWPYGGDDD